jgi:hypothetical protein
MSRRVNLAEVAAKTVEAMAPASDEPHVGQPQRARQLKSKAPEAVRFDELERKEARVRLDQYEALQSLSRQLNRSRNRRGERITENTLIRVAIDLLLSRQDEVAGTTEAELRTSVGL